MKNPVRILNHPHGKEFIRGSRVARLLLKGIVCYVDEKKDCVRYLGYSAARLEAQRAAISSATFVDKGLGITPHGAISIARQRGERRKREADAIGCHSESEWRGLLAKYENRCVRCTIRAQDTYAGRLTRDHIIPLISGGNDFISNIQPLCRRCNSWKGAREMDFRPAWEAKKP